ncbi:Cytochrome P450 83B1 [Linum perenne]
MPLLLVYLLLALLPITIILISLLLHTQNRTQTYYHLPPGPLGLPIIGNLFQLDGSLPHISLTQLSHKYGRHLISLRMGSVKTIVVSSPEMAKHVLRTHDHVLSSRPSRVGQRKLSYGGINMAFSPYNAYSRTMKKLCIVHLFNTNKVQSFSHIRTYEVSRLMEKISQSSYKPFNLSSAMISLAGTLVCRMAFGKKYEDEVRFQSLITDTQSMFTSFFFSDHFPCLGFVDRLTGLMSRLDMAFKELDGFCGEIFDEHHDTNRVKDVDDEEEDVVDVLVRIMKDDESFNNVQLTVDHVKAIIMDLFIAGTDTVAAALVWGMTYLMKNPLAMHKAQLEVRQSVGIGKGFVTEEVVKQLPYLKSVVKETLRLQPPAPLLVRESSQDFNLGEYKIPSKTVVYVNAWAIGRDLETWGVDSEEFKPERFMGTKSVVVDNKYMIPFGGGRRKCPGMHMGIATVELTLANLLYWFDWEMPEGMTREDLDMDVILGLTMHKKHDLCLVARRHV